MLEMFIRNITIFILSSIGSKRSLEDTSNSILINIDGFFELWNDKESSSWCGKGSLLWNGEGAVKSELKKYFMRSKILE